MVVIYLFYRLKIDRPLNPSAIGYFQTMCKLLLVPANACCMNLESQCEHKQNVIKTSYYKWYEVKNNFKKKRSMNYDS